ncbi:hypothetical protein QFC21_003594 [Naganishia friedmannii]|uniref:Uncharacterized protein n=1 Tax=Naganishia friedmannii TaxID=89922 RepID=A0ACC2VN66_9TREE|nr:hypothetical protein QFC21_003594 [Naganishia friedmannii]
MKFSIIAVALFAAILGQAAPVPGDAPVAETKDSLTNLEVAKETSPRVVVDPEMASHVALHGSVCSPGLKVAGFARLADYTVYGSDFNGDDLAARYASGYFDNFGGPIIARALAKSDALPSLSEVFVQAQNANYFWHKSGTVAQVIGGLSPNRDYATYVTGGCEQFSGDAYAAVYAKCCE